VSGSRPSEQTIDQSLRSSLEGLSNQLDLLESWDSVASFSTSVYVDINVMQFVDYDGHVSATTIPYYFVIAGDDSGFYR